MDIQLEEIIFDEPIIDTLFAHKIINAATYSVLYNSTVVHDGYIAGGFASYFAKVFFENKQDKTFLSRLVEHQRSPHTLIRKYLGELYHSAEEIQKNRLHKSGVSDIDVWYVSSGYEAEILTKQLQNVSTIPTVSGWGNEHYCGNTIPNRNLRDHGVGKQIVQAITAFSGPIEKTLSSFDIYNACVAIKGNTLYVPVGFKNLVETSQIHLHQWSGIHGIRRLAKWCRKQGYALTTPETKVLINEQIPTLLSALHDKKITVFGTVVKPQDFIKFMISQHKYTLSAANIMLMSVYMPSGSYHNSSSMLNLIIERERNVKDIRESNKNL